MPIQNYEFKIQKSPFFEFLILNFELIRLGVAKKTVDRMLEKVSRLYEQGADRFRIEAYLRRWCQWVRTGVTGIIGLGDCRVLDVYYTAAMPLADVLHKM